MGQKMAAIEEVGRRGHWLEKTIKNSQEAITALELCLKPVIVGIHSACVGAGVDLITAADIRYCTEDAWFQLKEVELGMAADVGSLQRLPKVIGNQSLVRELCYTGRKFGSKEAFECGLVNRVSLMETRDRVFAYESVLVLQTFKTQDELVKECLKLAEVIASKSPIAVQGTKKNLIYSMDHTNQEGLDQIVSCWRWQLVFREIQLTICFIAAGNQSIEFDE